MSSTREIGVLSPSTIPPPDSIEEVGVPRSLLEELALKSIYVTVPSTLRELAVTLRLTYGVVDELFRHLRSEKLAEVTGMRGNIPEIALTSFGRARALELLALSGYTGAAPVSIDSYVQQVRQQSVREVEVNRSDITRAFGHLVLEQETLDKLGTALNSGSSIFLYGPSGCGKTEIAVTIHRVFLGDHVWVPYAVQTDGQIITVYDPHVHVKVEDPALEDSDARWVLCRRPTVLVGGELTIEMLELQINPASRFYAAPAQMKANNGILIIDDFGRQRLSPEELLNRWVVPLDRRIDFLTLAGGRKIEIPFELFVVFSTNLDPSTLADPAFMRRIQTKIKIGTISRDRFRRIFVRVCANWGIPLDTDAVENDVMGKLLDAIENKYKEPLRACQPRDILNQMRWAARYESREPILNSYYLLRAADAYFLSGTDDVKERLYN